MFLPWAELGRRFERVLRELDRENPARLTDLRASSLFFFPEQAKFNTSNNPAKRNVNFFVVFKANPPLNYFSTLSVHKERAAVTGCGFSMYQFKAVNKLDAK